MLPLTGHRRQFPLLVRLCVVHPLPSSRDGHPVRLQTKQTSSVRGAPLVQKCKARFAPLAGSRGEPFFCGLDILCQWLRMVDRSLRRLVLGDRRRSDRSSLDSASSSPVESRDMMQRPTCRVITGICIRPLPGEDCLSKRSWQPC